MRVRKWGSGLAIRLPADIVEKMQLKAGDNVELRVADYGSVKLNTDADRAQLIAQVRRLRGKLPADFQFNRGDDAARPAA